MKWAQTDKGWKIVGDNDDKYGHSWFDGTCENNQCDLVQTYKDGKLNGRSYFYNGTYTDKAISQTKTTNTISGTWGYEKGNTSNGGDWNAVATCKRVK